MSKVMELYSLYTNALVLLFTGFALGYLTGRLNLLYVTLVQRAENVAPAANTLRAALRDNPAAEKAKIEINAGKYVGEINTSSMQKTQDVTLGKTTQTQDDINSSVSKLAQLKGK